MVFDKNRWLNIEWKNVYKEHKDSNAILTLIEENDIKEFYKRYPKTSDKLNGIPFAIKDNFSLHGVQTTGGTGVLKGYEPNFSSAVIKKLVEAGAIPVMKTNVDELAMGGTGTTSKYGSVYNPFAKDRMIGGSSSGSAYVSSLGIVPFALGSDTGDSIRLPAAFGGTIGFKPTWGMISRHGIYDFAPTWDTVGFFSENVSQAAALLDVTAGIDREHDASIVESDQSDFLENINTKRKFKFGYYQEILDVSTVYIKERFNKTREKLEAKGHSFVKLDPNIDILNMIVPVYKIITNLEASSQNANLTGFLFGDGFDVEYGKTFEEKITDVRTKGFGYEVKKRFLLGQHSIINDKSLYYKAQKGRMAIKNELERLLEQCDVIINPAQAHPAHKINEKYSVPSIAADYLTTFNASGMPGITIGIKSNNELPIGISLHGRVHNDLEVLQTGKLVEEVNNE